MLGEQLNVYSKLVVASRDGDMISRSIVPTSDYSCRVCVHGSSILTLVELEPFEMSGRGTLSGCKTSPRGKTMAI